MSKYKSHDCVDFSKVGKEVKKIPPMNILLSLGLKEGDRFLDFGAGNGYFSVPASTIVGREGKVYAVDKSKKMFNHLALLSETFENIVSVHSDGLNIDKIIHERFDLIFLSHTLHELKDKELVLLNLKKLLKENGIFVVIEFDASETKDEDINEHRLSQKDAVFYLKDVGFNKFYSLELNYSEYAIISKI